MTAADPPWRVLAGLEKVAGNYRGVILDLWGVVHDGVRPYPGAIDALGRLRAAGLRLCLLSNAPRLAASVAARLDAMGIAAGGYDGLVTSGQLAVEALRKPPDPWHAGLGPRYLHIGPVHGFGLPAAISQRQVESPGAASFVLCTGTAPGGCVGDHAGVLAACAARRLPLLCANPDLEVLSGTVRAVCAGALARHYESLGGEVRYHGKPHAPAYRRCFEVLGGDARPVLAIGDALHTDIAGACAAGIDVAFVAGGIHRSQLGIEWGAVPARERLDALLAGQPHQPTFVLPRLVW